MKTSIRILPEGSDPWEFQPQETSLPLSQTLEAAGFPLNTRCGGRGLCRGCQVEVETDASRHTIKACQVASSSLPEDARAIHIPSASRRDLSLHGVSTFELLIETSPPPPRPGVGLAVDVGTTTVAAALWDLNSGHCLAQSSRENAQRRHGDNVVSRIAFAVEQPQGLELLRKSLVEDCLKPLIETLTRQAGLTAENITETTVAGNPTMLHTLTGDSLTGMATYPFTPVFLGEIIMDAAAMGLNWSGAVRLLPGLGPFVGSDITGGALAAGMCAAPAPCLLIDFGTNGEILLKHAGGYLATATAAGPAFEGGNLACGKPAGRGVVSSLSRGEDGQFLLRLVGDGRERPAGLTGAAYVDFIALGANEGWISPSGRFDRSHPEVIKVDNAEPGAAYRVNLAEGVYVSEADVAELLQAKAAVYGGVATLLEIAGIEAAELHKVLVAGGFGYHLNPENAIKVGLLPGLPRQRIHLIGNSSLGGASLLLHEQHQAEIATLVAQTRVIELNQTDCFEDHFTDGLMLPE